MVGQLGLVLLLALALVGFGWVACSLNPSAFRLRFLESPCDGFPDLIPLPLSCGLFCSLFLGLDLNGLNGMNGFTFILAFSFTQTFTFIFFLTLALNLTWIFSVTLTFTFTFTFVFTFTITLRLIFRFATAFTAKFLGLQGQS